MSQDSVPQPVIDPSLVATGPQTVAALVTAAKRKGGATPIRRGFVQPDDRNLRPQGGPLAALVRNRDRRALILFLLVLTSASKAPFNVSRDSTLWSRALDLGTGRSGREAISKTWQRLRALNLVEVTRVKRKADVTPLREDGSGEPYDYPDPNKTSQDRYLRLPVEFWLDGWYATLSLPAIAMLLVLLAEKPDVVLPLNRVPDWYGLSRSTAQRGFDELESVGLLRSYAEQRVEPLSPLGFTFDHHRRLAGSFAQAPGTGSKGVKSKVRKRSGATSPVSEATVNKLSETIDGIFTGPTIEPLRRGGQLVIERFASQLPGGGAAATTASTATQRRRQRRRRTTVEPD
jgi:hypothetical protein